MPNGLRRRYSWEEFSAPVEEPTYDPLTIDQFSAPMPEDQRPSPYGQNQDLLRGFRSTALGLDAGKIYRRADEVEAEGQVERANQFREVARRYEEAAARSQPRMSSFQDVQGVGDAVDYLQGGFGRLAPTMAAPMAAGIAGAVGGAALAGPLGAPAGFMAGVGGALGAAVPAFQMEAGEQASSQQADPYIRENTTAEERLREQNIKGAQNAALESLFPALFGGRVIGGAARRLAGEALAKSPLRRTLAVTREGGTEALTELTQTITGQQSLTRLNPNRDTSHDYVERIDSLILGALGGTSMSLGTTVPGYLMERVGQRAERGALQGARDLGRAGAELELRVIGEMQQRGVDVPLRMSRMTSDMMDEADRAEWSELTRRWQLMNTAYGEDSPEVRQIIDEAAEFLARRHPQWRPVSEGIMSREGINTGAGKNTLRLGDQGTPTPENPDINMLPDRPVAMFPEVGTAGTAKFQRRHLLRGEEQAQLRKWRNQGFISDTGMEAAQSVPLGQWLAENNASPEEVQAERDTMLRDINRRLQGNNSPENRAKLEAQKTALENAETYGDLYEQLNEYSVLQFPPSEVEGKFTPQDADFQRRSLELVTGANIREKAANRKKLLEEEGIRVKLRVGGHKDGRVLIKRDVIAHARNFFREELRSIPDGPLRDEAALLMGVFADPRVQSILYNGKEITQDDVLGGRALTPELDVRETPGVRGEGEQAAYRWRLENPEHRAALKLGPPKRGYKFGKTPQDPTTSQAPEDQINPEFDSRQLKVQDIPVEDARREVVGQLNRLQEEKGQLEADDNVRRTQVEQAIRAREFQLKRLNELAESGQTTVRRTVHDEAADITAYDSPQGVEAESETNEQLRKNIEIEKWIAQRRRAEERLKEATPGTKEYNNIDKEITRLTKLLQREWDPFGSRPSYNTADQGDAVGSTPVKPADPNARPNAGYDPNWMQNTYERDELGHLTYKRKGPKQVERVARYTRAEIRANPDKIYVFGDNLAGRGLGGQAGAARGEPNAVGVPTKRLPTNAPQAFFGQNVAEEKAAIKAAIDKLVQLQREGKTIVLPADGLGTGRAQLAQRAPEVAAYLEEQLARLEERPTVAPQAETNEQLREAGTLNVYHGAGENAGFSNLAERPFEYEGRQYRSVEHAYQTLKSGEFDETAYRSRALKPRGTKAVNQSTSEQLMTDLIRASFRQNPEAAQALVETGNKRITHLQEQGFWREAFPRALMQVREELLQEIPPWMTANEVLNTPAQQEQRQAPTFQELLRLARDVGIKNPVTYIRLAQRVSKAEKQTNEKTRDPVTGKEFTALELMDQLESEGKPRMGAEFSKRRGYTQTEINDFNQLNRLTTQAIEGGIPEADVQFLGGVIRGDLDLPAQFRGEQESTSTPQKTATGNVVVKNGVPAAKAYAAADPENRVYTLRQQGQAHFGNPFTHLPVNRTQGTVLQVGSVAEAVQAYRDWLTTTKYDGQFGPQLDARKQWILEQLPQLKGKELVYYRELNEPSHANVLDELVQAAEAPQQENENPLAKIPQEDIKVTKIISGGQIGADYGGLRAARELGLETGGTMPPGFRTANRDPNFGRNLANEFGLTEGEADPAVFPKRTMKNVDDADATIAFRFKQSAGTDKTIGYAQTGRWQVGRTETSYDGHRPVLVVTEMGTFEAAQKIREFVARTGAKTLNIAGHRQMGRTDYNGESLEMYVEQVLVEALQEPEFWGDRGPVREAGPGGGYSEIDYTTVNAEFMATVDGKSPAELRRMLVNKQSKLGSIRSPAFKRTLQSEIDVIKQLLGQQGQEQQGWQQGLPEHTIDRTLQNADGTKRLASTSRDGKIRINPVETVQEFFEYFEGRVAGATSEQKREVLGKLVREGWPRSKIRQLIRTPGMANRFLVLHEADHVAHNDRDVYWLNGRDNLLTPDKIAIEVRATKNALDQLQREVNGGLKASRQVSTISDGQAFEAGSWQWSRAQKGEEVYASTYENLCIGCADGNVSQLRKAGLPAVRISLRHKLPGLDFYSPHYIALTKVGGKYYLVDDPQKNLFKVLRIPSYDLELENEDSLPEKDLQVLKNQYEPRFIELTAENLRKHYGITKAAAEEQYTYLSPGTREIYSQIPGFLEKYYADRNITPDRGYDGLIEELQNDLDNRPKASKQYRDNVANDVTYARLARNLREKGYRLVQDENGEYMVLDKDGKRIPTEEENVKNALNGVPPDMRNYATVEEAMRDEDVRTAVEEAKRWLIRAFGPQILDALDWMLVREAPGGPMAGYYVGDEYYDVRVGRVVSDFLTLAVDSLDPLSIAFHEGMHKFVKQLANSGDQNLYQRLVKAATAPHVMKQMEKLLADYPMAIDQIRTDPEEAVAYAFQFYAASRLQGGPKFRIQPSLKETFTKIIDTIKRMLGIMTHARASQEIFDALFEGRVARDGIEPLRQYQERSFEQYTKDVWETLRRAVPRIVSSPIIQLSNQRNANGQPIRALKKLADLWHSQPLKGGPTGVVYRTAQMEGQYRNRWHKILTDNNATEADMNAALKNMQAMREPSNQLERDLQHFFQQMYAYQFLRGENPVKVLKIVDEQTGQREWVTPDRVDNYWPRIWSAEQILANEIEFREVMAEEGELTDEQITNFIDMLQATNGLEAGSELQQYRAEFSPFNAAINARVFDFINENNAHRFAKFQEQNMAKVIDRYIRQAVHRREHSRSFGHDGSVTRDLLNQARAEGATPKQIQYAEKVVQGLEGRLGTDKVSDLAREVMVTSMSITNFAVLAMATLSSIVDPLGVLVRTGSLKSAAKTFQAGVKQIVADARKQKVPDQELTEYLGIIEEDMVQDMLNNMERGIYMNEKLRKLNRFFFRSIGLEQWTRGTRIGATRASLEYLKKNANNERALAELDLEPGMIQEFEDRIKIKPEEFNPENPGDPAAIEQARRVQNAIFRMVDESILRPSAATRPLWSSDMRFRLLGHLKSYTFTFHNQILRQVLQRARTADSRAQAALAFMPLLTYVPVMIAADMLRDAIQGDDKDRDWDEIMGRALQRSAILGMGTFVMDAEDEMEWGNMPTNTVLGPVIDTSLNLGRAAVNPDADFLNAAAKILPYNALWRKWGDE